MSTFTTAELVPWLIGELDYSPSRADSAARELVAADPRVRRAFYHWWKTGEFIDFDAHGYNVQRLADEHGMNPIAAYLALDWLLKDPEAALVPLRRGHDWVK